MTIAYTSLNKGIFASRWFLPLLVLALAWYAVIRIVCTDWTIDPQYTYGIIVPPLVLGLLLMRWEDRPDPARLSPLLSWIFLVLLFAATLVIAVIIPVAEANPDWRPLGGVVSLAAVTLTLSLLGMIGGKAWVKHFSFPICFSLIAVPWPRNFEQWVMNPLVSWNTGVTLEILHWAGFEAMRQRHLIVLPTGVLGIEEACSGIRSLQSGLMTALFFGEFFRLSVRGRLLLVSLSVFTALIGNICRSSLLALIASSSGMEEVSKWHDGAGLLVLLITFVTIFLCAWCWRHQGNMLLLKRSSVPSGFPRELRSFVLISVVVLLAAALLFTEIWFMAHERGGIHPWSWSLNPRHGHRGVIEVPISSETLRMLYYPDGFSEKWISTRGEQGQVFYFQWPAGRTAAQAVSMHNPEVCLSNIGIELNSPLQPETMSIGKDQLSFNAWLFNDNGSPVYVFHTLIEQGGELGDLRSLKDSPAGRLRATLGGQRNHGQRMIEVALWNLPSEQAARAALVHYLHDSVKMSDASFFPKKMNLSNDPNQFSQDSHGDIPPNDRLKNSEELPDYEEDEISNPKVAANVGSTPRNWSLFFILFLLLLAVVLASPLYRSLKDWRAEGLLKDSAVAFAYGDNDRGMSLMKQAVALSPGGESTQYAVELFNARNGDAASLTKLVSRMNAGKSSSEELLGIAEIETKHGNREVVNVSIGKLPRDLSPAQSLRLALIQALIKNQDKGPVEAAELCLQSARSMSGVASSRLRTQAALYLFSDKSADKEKEGVDLLFGVMREKTDISIDAARILARLSLQADQKGTSMITNSGASEVVRFLPMLPGHQSGDTLLAADLEIHADPSSQEAVVKSLTGAYQHASRSQMLEFARWLNAKGLHDEVIAFAGAERPRNDTDWLLIVLDAESAKGDWNNISEMLNTPAGLGIPDAVKHLFLARIATMAGDASTAEDEWRSVNGSLHLEKPETLAYIAGYEEEIGARDQAVDTYQEMVNRKETRLAGLIGIIRSQPRSATAEKLIPLYEALLNASPDFSDAAGDLAYLKLLANRDQVNSSAIADKLLLAQPNSLARISIAALGRLKNGDTQGALSLYQNNRIDWATSPDSWKAVCVAVLRAAGDMPDADRLAASINLFSLNPQEKDLLQTLPAAESGKK